MNKLTYKILIPVLFILGLSGIFLFISIKIISEKIASDMSYSMAPLIMDNIDSNAKRFISRNDIDSFQIYAMSVLEKEKIVQKIVLSDIDGAVISSTDRSLIGISFVDELIKYKQDSINKLGKFNFVMSKLLMIEISEYLPPDIMGTITIYFSKKFIASKMNTIIAILSSIVFLSIVLITIFIIFFTGRCLSPIISLKKHINEIKNGNLSVNLEYRQSDEIGDISKYVNEMTMNLRDLLKSIINRSSQLSDAGDSLSSNMIETAAAIKLINSN
ncbi:MAG: HAMP domain-containing protein, partial [Spirochaetes bacterium]|nr:HAMP domain-containing protein [Spirochaetota bacterium]